MTARVWRRALLAGCLAGAMGPALALMPGAIPLLVSQGPYGDPFAITPRIRHVELGPDWQAALTAPDEYALGTPAGLAVVAGPARTSTLPAPPVDDDRDEAIPALPGTFKRAQTPIPGVLGKPRIVAPHLAPDVAVPLGRRTTLGLFGEVGTTDPDARNSLVQSLKAHEVGAGVSLQYRFGQ